MNMTISKAEDQFRKLMGILAVVFLIGAILFAVTPDIIVRVINWIGGIFNDASRAPIISKISVENYWDTFYRQPLGNNQGMRLPSHGMYVSLAVAYMVMLTVCCGLVFYDTRKYAFLTVLVIIGKFASSLVGLAMYLWSYPYFANLVVMITDFPIAVVVLIFYLRAKAQMPATTPPPGV